MKLRTKISLIFFLVFGIQINAMDSNPVIAAFEPSPELPVDPELTDEFMYGSTEDNEGPLDPAPQPHSALTHSSINPLTVQPPKVTPTSYGSNVAVRTGLQNDPSFNSGMLDRGGWNSSLQRSEQTVSANQAGLTPTEMAQIEKEQALRKAARAKSLEGKQAARRAARLEAQKAKSIQHQLNLEAAKQSGAVKAQQIIEEIEARLSDNQIKQQEPSNSKDLGGLPEEVTEESNPQNAQKEPVLSRSEAARAEREKILQELRKRFEIGEVGSGDKFQEMQKARVTLFEIAVRDGSQKNFIENYFNKDIKAAQQLLRPPSLFTPEKIEYTIFKIAQEKYFSNFMTEAQQNALDVIGQRILEKFPIETQFAIDYMYTKYGPPTFDTPDQAEEGELPSLDVEQGEGDTNSNVSGDDLLGIEENPVQLEEQGLVAQDSLTNFESLAEDLQKEVVGIKSLVTSSNTVKASVKGYMGLQAIFSQQVLGAQSIATIAFTNGELTPSQITQLNNTVQTLTAQEQKLAKEKQKMKQKIAHLQVLNEKIMQKLDVYLKKLEAENAVSSTQALQAKIQQIEAYRDALIDEQSYLAAYESNLDNQVDHNKRVTQLYSELLEIFKKEKQEVTEAEQDGEVDDEDEMEDPSEEKECARGMVQEELLKYQLEGIISELQRLNEVFGADFVNFKSKVITAVSSLISNINKSDSILELIEQGVKKSKTQHIFTSEEQLLAAEPFNLLGVSIASVARTLEALGDKINDLMQDHPEKEDKVICQMLAGRLMALNKKLEEADKLFKVLEEQNAFALYLISLT